MDASALAKRKGTVVVIVSFLAMALLYPPGATMPGMFVAGMAETFGVARTAVTLMITISIVFSMVGAVVFGRLYNRHSIRHIMPALLVVLALGYLGTAYAASMWQVYLFAVVRGFFSAGLTTLPVSIAINNWYAPSIRGKAVGVAMVGSGVGAMLLSPVLGYILETSGWRAGYTLFAVLSLVMVVPVVLFFTPSPTPLGLAPVGGGPAAGAAGELRGPGVAAAAKTPVFWLTMLIMLLLAGTSQSWNTNGAAYLGDIGMPESQQAAILSIISAGLIVGKLALGAISDRFGIKVCVFLGGLLLAGAYPVWIAASHMLALAPVAAVIKGLGMSSVTIVAPLLVAFLFGNRDYSVFVGYFQIASGLGSAMMPLLTSLMYEFSGSYIPAWWMVCAVGMLTLVCVQYAIRRRQSPA